MEVCLRDIKEVLGFCLMRVGQMKGEKVVLVEGSAC